jgi:transcriptional regulator
VTRLTERFESASAAPWRVSDAPPDFIDKQLGAIVGIEITVTRLAGKWKVSQNRPAQDRAGVVEALGDSVAADSLAMAQMIKERSSS